MNTADAKPLRIMNNNNKLQCCGFIEIHFAPPRETIRDADFDKLYMIKTEAEDIFVKLESFLRVPFNYISSVYTIPATGLNSQEWAAEWQKKYPKTKPDTEMAVYCYQRLKNLGTEI